MFTAAALFEVSIPVWDDPLVTCHIAMICHPLMSHPGVLLLSNFIKVHKYGATTCWARKTTIFILHCFSANMLLRTSGKPCTVGTTAATQFAVNVLIWNLKTHNLAMNTMKGCH